MIHRATAFVLPLVLKLKTARPIDSLAYMVGVGGNAAVLPQIVKAWNGKAPGLAVLTWLLFIGSGLIWLTYAIIHRQKPLIVAQIVGLTCNLAVVVGWMVNNWLR
jgi:uncharacterized protein with PQ loop repeat